jgi:hypothetical protein
MDKLIDVVLEQIKKDVAEGDMTSIEELLRNTSEVTLLAYLPEDQWAEHATPEPTEDKQAELALAMIEEGRLIDTDGSVVLIEVSRELYEEFKGEEE